MPLTSAIAVLSAALIVSSTPAPPAPGPGDVQLRDLVSRVYPLVSRVEDLAGTQRTTQTETQTTYTLQAALLFAKDSATVSPAAKKSLDEVARKIAAARPTQPIKIIGYTDDLGSAEHGLTLSRNRANAIKAALLQGRPELASVNFTTQGLGEARPIADNRTEAGRKRNRRVEIVVPTPAG